VRLPVNAGTGSAGLRLGENLLTESGKMNRVRCHDCQAFNADPEDIVVSSEAFRKKKEEIRERIQQEFREEMTSAPWWKKPYLNWKRERRIQGEIEKELERLLPPDALYAAAKE